MENLYVWNRDCHSIPDQCASALIYYHWWWKVGRQQLLMEAFRQKQRSWEERARKQKPVIGEQEIGLRIKSFKRLFSTRSLLYKQLELGELQRRIISWFDYWGMWEGDLGFQF
ncbi:hypothetical protein DR999_PMT13470 [Platysternon megacephalum]|uniref:Uncharacterized protein n=1 Tax=Platysternon megacephalum TaxID=55544 RepID=A0A4D9E683_9SAUR|nr:hypothetical protein DR999_PMT13470 [Platysternon megacephalum]